MRRILQGILLRITAVSLLLLLQGPAMLVQEVAWTSMLVKYSRDKGLSRGVVETFDGKHPCPLCRKAQEIRKKEQQKSPDTPVPPNRRLAMSWGEMLAPGPLVLQPPGGTTVGFPVPAWVSRWTLRNGGPPPHPPPESA